MSKNVRTAWWPCLQTVCHTPGSHSISLHLPLPPPLPESLSIFLLVGSVEPVVSQFIRGKWLPSFSLVQYV